jgi:coatomer protein complex subunit alpha (xenin)
MQIMRRQLGVMDFKPLKPLFLACASSAQATAPSSQGAPPVLSPLFRANRMPRLSLALPALVERLKQGYGFVTSGKFAEALDTFVHIAHAITLTVVKDRQQVSEIKELIGICREYISAMRLEMERKKMTEAPKQIALAAYFTHCNLQATHTMLSLRSAMTTAYKLKLPKAAAGFARRLIELNPRPEISTQARKVIQFGEAAAGDEFSFDYDERNPFVVCGISFVPIYRGSPMARCTFCKAPYLPSHKGKPCVICLIGEIGGDAPGLEEAYVLDVHSS